MLPVQHHDQKNNTMITRSHFPHAALSLPPKKERRDPDAAMLATAAAAVGAGSFCRPAVGVLCLQQTPNNRGVSTAP